MPHESPDTPATKSKLATRYERVQALRHEYPGAEIAAFFIAGVLFDIVTLSRIDNVLNLMQQAVYLVALGGLMVLEERYRAGVATPPRALVKAWRYSEDVIHFLFGSLLSVFTLFYLKSTSGFASVLFMSVWCTLLVVNELPRFREVGPVVRWALLSLCLTSYLALLLPLVAGFLSTWLFLAAVILSAGALGWLARRLATWTRNAAAMWRGVAAPVFGMQALLVVAYFAGVIPPVPLSVQFIGIYHEVVPPGRSAPSSASPGAVAPGPAEAPAEPRAPAPAEDPRPRLAGVLGGAPEAGAPAMPDATEEPGTPVPTKAVAGAGALVPPRAYALKHLRPWWKFWQHGDQDFAARPGDVIYCFARVFAPSRFRDAVYVRWQVKGRGGWEDQGRARLDISGGRDEGFRAFATKRNYRPGRWRVEIETEDGRDLGVIHFDLVNDDSTGSRTFSVDAG